MDKIPKFRRKPKPPAIETAIDRSERSGRNFASVAQNIAGSAALSPQQHSLRTQKPSKIAALKNLRLRGPAKRARDDPPADLPLSPPPPPAIVAQDGMSPRKPSRPTMQSERDLEKNRSRAGPKIPAFLMISNQEIESKFQDLTWTERDRVAQGLRNDDTSNARWGLYKQDDTHTKGVMDRYMNIRPWNHNRVKLRVPEGQLDYVNASAIVLKMSSDKSKPPLRYIAMQGPTEASFDYVWRMVAEQTASPAVIVQLTSMYEAGALKCDQYFPYDEEYAVWDLNESDAWGDGWKAQVTFDSCEEVCGGAIEKRKLLLRVQGDAKARVVWHLLYRRWPDFGVPTLEDLDTFFELMRLSRSLSDPHSARVVHCSAGVGRTGTFICLEHLIRELASGSLERHDTPLREGPDLIYETVDALRQQRRAMVQGDTQYRFIYQVMRKLWQDKYGMGENANGSEPVAKRLEVPEFASPVSPSLRAEG